MLDGLRPLGLRDAARRLSVDQFEVVRLMVASGEPLEHLQLDPERIEALRELGGIEESWWVGVILPEGVEPRRARVRAALQCLVDRGHVGEANATRLDNLWRGLPEREQLLLRHAVAALVHDGHLLYEVSAVGPKIAIAHSARATIESIAAGHAETPGLAAIYQE